MLSVVATNLLRGAYETSSMSGVTRRYADSRKVQRGDGHYSVTIPAKIVEELDIEKGDDLLFECVEGEDRAEVIPPSK